MDDKKEVKHKQPKNPIRFQVVLNEEQKLAKAQILENTITVITGFAGSGKTLLAIQTGLDLLFKRNIDKLIISRPLVTSGEEVGILPGGIREKTDPMLYPLYDSMYRMYSKEKIEALIEEGKIEICPLAFVRGRNFSEGSCVIIDESQNMNMSQTELVLSRVCKGAKLILVGDSSQIDLKQKKDSGFSFLKRLEGVESFAYVVLKTNHRDPIVEKILAIYKEFREN